MGFLLSLHKDTSLKALDNSIFIHLLADYSVNSLEHTIYNAILLKQFPGVSVVNSNQDFKAGEIIAPGIFLKLVAPDFPDGTFHICMLHIDYRHRENYVLASYKNQYFLAPDNGVLSIAFGDEEISYYALPLPEEGSDIFKQTYLPVLETLKTAKTNPNEHYVELENPKKFISPVPPLNGNILRLTVLYNDSHGNAYFNIDQNEFKRIIGNNNFSIRLGFKDNIEGFSMGYNSVPEGQKLAFFGLGGLLQIAINCGSAAQYLGLEKGKIVMVEIQ